MKILRSKLKLQIKRQIFNEKSDTYVEMSSNFITVAESTQKSVTLKINCQ
jgi:hypothetical protein